MDENITTVCSLSLSPSAKIFPKNAKANGHKQRNKRLKYSESLNVERKDNVSMAPNIKQMITKNPPGINNKKTRCPVLPSLNQRPALCSLDSLLLITNISEESKQGIAKKSKAQFP